LEEQNFIERSSGRSRSPSEFPSLEYYFRDTNGEYPCIVYFENTIGFHSFLKDLKEFALETVSTREIYEGKIKSYEPSFYFLRIQKGYFIEIEVSNQEMIGFSVTHQKILKKYTSKQNSAAVASVTLYKPSESSSLKDLDLEKKFESIFSKNILEKNSQSGEVGMICSEDGDYYIRNFYIKEDYTVVEPDLHYGEGFSKFHEKLVKRIHEKSKGLILFHGHPGTGKTFYIRSLIKDLISSGKYVIYLPPNMVEMMIDPAMMNFLSSAVLEKAEDGKSCVLLIEDAEPLLASRGTENRTGGITNLLNVTDGILNDMLSLQVIATFNTELHNIDQALLRPERLIARKEFKKLRKEDAIILAKKLGILKKIHEDMTLAEIYAERNERETLVHEYDNEKKKIGF